MEQPPVDLSQVRKERQGKAARRGLQVDSNGDFIYPERVISITIVEALALAHEIIQKFPESTQDPKALASQREASQFSTVDDCLRVLELHRQYPSHYHQAVLLATAEALLKRFPAA